MKTTERLLLGLALESMAFKDTLYLEESGLNFFNSNNDVDDESSIKKAIIRHHRNRRKRIKKHLKRCPCCGGSPYFYVQHSFDYDEDEEVTTVCISCGCGMQTRCKYIYCTEGDSATYRYDQELADIWNRRERSN